MMTFIECTVRVDNMTIHQQIYLNVRVLAHTHTPTYSYKYARSPVKHLPRLQCGMT